jgi:vitamin B12 transporter
MNHPFTRRAALSALALSIGQSPAYAQANLETALASVLVTASRTPQAPAEVLSDHLVLTAADIERSGAASLIDLLQQQRGIEVSRNGGPGTNGSVFLRGADGKQNVVLVDGVRIGSSTTGAANWTALPLANIERVEIIYGPLATLYGADAIGGVVQVFTRRGSGVPAATGAIGAGSDSARLAEAGLSGSSGAFSYAIAVAREEDAGFSATRPGNSSYNPDKDGYSKDSANGQLAYTPVAGQEFGMLFMHSHLDAQFDAGASAYNARSVQDLDNVALYTRQQLTPAWKLTAQASRADDKSLSDSSAAASGKSRISTRQRGYSLQNDLLLGGGMLQLLLERREEDVISSSTAALTTGRTTDSLAASYSLRVDAHQILASMRRDDSTQYGARWTGGLGYGYRISPSLRLNASAGTSFRAPTFNELYYPGFGVAGNQPERGRNIEGGLSYRDGATEASAIYYRNRIADLLVTAAHCPVESATHPFGCAYNVNRATLSGLTLGVRRHAGSIDLDASLDLQDPRDDTTGKRLARRARRHANFGADYNAGALSLGAGLQLSARRFDDVANRNVLGGYGLLNVHASYRLAQDWSLFARWNNATDKQYELARSYATAGSQVFAGIRYGSR